MPAAQTLVNKSVTSKNATSASARNFEFRDDISLAVPATLPTWQLGFATAGAMVAPLLVIALVGTLLGGSLIYALTPLVSTGELPGIGRSLVAMAGIAAGVLVLLPVLLASRETAECGRVPVPPNSPLVKLVADVARRLRVDPPKIVAVRQFPSVGMRLGAKGLHQLEDANELVVGLPLLRTLPTADIAGLIANELGQLAVREGRAQRFLVVEVNQWLRSAACPRADSPLTRPGALLMNVMSGITAQLTASVLREIQQHGDWYQTQVIGSDRYKAIAEHMHLARRAYDEIEAQLADPENTEYPADIGHLIDERIDERQAAAQSFLREAMLASPSCLDEHHLPGYERLDFVAELGDVKPALVAPESALSLVIEPQSLARRVALAWYQQDLQLDIDESQLLSETSILRRLEANRELNQVLEKYFLGFFHRTRFLPPGDINTALKVPAEKRLAQINDACAEIRRMSPEARNALREYDEAVKSLLADARAAQTAELNGQEHDSDDYRDASNAYKSADSELNDIEQRFAERMVLGLAGALADAVLSDPALAKVLRNEVGKLHALQTAFYECRRMLVDLRIAVAKAEIAKSHGSKESLAIHRREIARLVSSIGAKFDRLPSPDPTEKRSLLPVIESEVDAASDGSATATGKEYVRAVERHYLHLLVRLSEIALETETRHNIRLKLID